MDGFGRQTIRNINMWTEVDDRTDGRSSSMETLCWESFIIEPTCVRRETQLEIIQNGDSYNLSIGYKGTYTIMKN